MTETWTWHLATWDVRGTIRHLPLSASAGCLSERGATIGGVLALLRPEETAPLVVIRRDGTFVRAIDRTAAERVVGGSIAA